MAKKLGVYESIWRPEEHRIKKAYQMIPCLSDAYYRALVAPDELTALNPANGWGSYEVFLDFLRDYLGACVEYPAASVEVSR